MVQDTKNCQEYISNQRYIVMLLDLETKRVYYSKRFGTLSKAIAVAGEYSPLADIQARIIDTKTGEII